MEQKINKFVEKRAKINDTTHEAVLADYVDKAQKKYKYTLYNHQLNAVHSLLTKMDGLGVLAMEMGTGKTIPALVYARIYHMIYNHPVIYVTPANLMNQWQEEGKTFDGQDIVIVDKIRDMKKLQKMNPTCCYFIVSFDIFCKLTNFEEDEKFIIVVDEAHTLRNDGITSVKVQNMMETISAYRLLLTATPLINNGSEAFNLLKILFPDDFNNRDEFLNYFFEQEKDIFGHTKLTNMKNIPTFFKLFDIVCIKAYKSDALPNLPPKIRTIYSFKNIDEELEAKMKKYNELVKRVHHTEGYQKTKADSLELGKQSNDLYIETEKSKARQCLPMILEKLEEFPDDKFVIFVEHIEPLEYLVSKIPGAIGLTGKSPPGERRRVIKTMRNKKHPNRILIATIGAYGKGYNFSPGITKVIFVGLAMTYSEMYQAEDRCHRADTDQPILCFWIFCEGSRDKRTLNLIEDKHKMTQALFVGIKEYQEHLAKRQRTIEDDNFFDHWCKYFPEKYKQEMEKEKQEEEEQRHKKRKIEKEAFDKAMEEYEMNKHVPNITLKDYDCGPATPDSGRDIYEEEEEWQPFEEEKE